MKKITLIIFVSLFCAITFFNLFSLAEQEMVVIYQRPESDIDTRNDYHIELLRVALEKTSAKYGPFRLKPTKTVMNEIRIVKMLINGMEGVDVMFRPTSKEDERQLNPVRIPLDKGLLGYRIFLIHKKDQPKFRSITSLDKLKKLKVGQGRDWNDVKIYEHNNFKIVTGLVYEGLFEMLLKGRFDYFARGVEEAYPEYEARRKEMPDLHVEESIVLNYPFPRYFWVSNNKKGDFLRERLVEGLEIMIKDGSFEQIFRKYKSDAINMANLKSRKVFRIENSFLPDATPINRPELWYDPFKD